MIGLQSRLTLEGAHYAKENEMANELRKVLYTVRVSTEMHRFGDGKRMPDPQGYSVEFFEAGEFVETRSYQFDVDEMTMLTRIANWVRLGKLNG